MLTGNEWKEISFLPVIRITVFLLVFLLDYLCWWISPHFIQKQSSSNNRRHESYKQFLSLRHGDVWIWNTCFLYILKQGPIKKRKESFMHKIFMVILKMSKHTTGLLSMQFEKLISLYQSVYTMKKHVFIKWTCKTMIFYIFRNLR